MHLCIRPASPADADVLAPLLAEVNDLHADALPNRFRRVPAGPGLAAFLRARIAEANTQALIAEDAGAPVGFLVANLRETAALPIAFPRRYAEIETLVVAGTARRGGVGTALVRRAHTWATSAGAQEIQLVVWELDDDARRFYERLGYVTQRRTLWRSLPDDAGEAPPPTETAPTHARPDERDRPERLDVTIATARPNDAEDIHKLQYLCYQTEAALYDDWSIPPLTETLAELSQAIDTDLVLAARLGEEIVGSVRGRLVGGTCHVGRLVVHPRLRRRGLATRLMADLETRFQEAEGFALFTGHRSDANLRLYHRLGYAETHRDAVSPLLTLVHLEKRVAPP